MPDRHIYNLLSLYMTNTISKEESAELKARINLSDDEELGDVLNSMWDKYNVYPQPEKRILDEMFNQIKKQVRPFSLRRKMDWALRIAAILLIPLLSLLSVYLFNNTNGDSIYERNEMVVEADKGQKAKLTLSDGTKIRLNSESMLVYNQNFGKESRDVTLKGEAYFEVAKDSIRPFIVHTNFLDIEVLGTSFNVYSYENEEKIEMTLISGRIKIETHTNPVNTIYLSPNEKASFNKISRRILVEKTDNRFETAWLRGGLVFRSESMKQVIYKLERRYGVTIHLSDPKIEEDIFTGSFDSDNIIDVMKILRTHYEFTYKIMGNDVYVSSQD